MHVGDVYRVKGFKDGYDVRNCGGKKRGVVLRAESDIGANANFLQRFGVGYDM
jgi:hypothetical protein